MDGILGALKRTLHGTSMTFQEIVEAHPEYTREQIKESLIRLERGGLVEVKKRTIRFYTGKV